MLNCIHSLAVRERGTRETRNSKPQISTPLKISNLNLVFYTRRKSCGIPTSCCKSPFITLIFNRVQTSRRVTKVPTRGWGAENTHSAARRGRVCGGGGWKKSQQRKNSLRTMGELKREQHELFHHWGYISCWPDSLTSQRWRPCCVEDSSLSAFSVWQNMDFYKLQ
jgi:hypothetical protein